MEKKEFWISVIVFGVLNACVTLGIFVNYPAMQAYAVSKDSFQQLCEQVSQVQQDVSDIKTYLMSK